MWPFKDSIAPHHGAGIFPVMKSLLLVLAAVLVGCGKKEGARKKLTSEETAEVIEKGIRKNIKKPSGALTEADLEKVDELNLSGTHISDAGLKEVAKLKNLSVLYLHSNPITDAGLKELTKLKQLERLLLVDTQISDKGLKELAKLERLILLQLNYTKVTKAGMTELKKSLPKCNISGPNAPPATTAPLTPATAVVSFR